MPKNIKPLDDSSTTPQPLPDRSKLSELYAKPLKDISISKESSRPLDSNPEIASSRFQWKFAVIANLLLVIPFAISHLSISKIYTLTGPSNVFDAASNQLTMTVLTISTFIPWILALRYLSNLANRYNTNLSAILVVYGFFVFPALAIITNLRSHISIWILLPLTLVASQVYVQIMINALLSSKTGFARYRSLFIAVLLMCAAAIFIQAWL
jgi:hypothetical protein